MEVMITISSTLSTVMNSELKKARRKSILTKA